MSAVTRAPAADAVRPALGLAAALAAGGTPLPLVAAGALATALRGWWSAGRG